MIKKFIITLLCCFFLTYLASRLDTNYHAQYTNKMLNLELENTIQDPSDNSFFVIATITSGLTTQRADIQWFIPSHFEIIQTQAEQDTDNLIEELDLIKDAHTKAFIKIKPIQAGESNIKAVVRTYQSDSRYLTTANLLFSINNNLEIEPDNKVFQDLKFYAQISNISFKTTIFIFILFIIFKIFQFIFFKINPPTIRKKLPKSDSKILVELEKLKNQSIS